MTKSELVLSVSGASDIPPEAVGKALNAILDTIVAAVVSGDTVTLPGFGTFARKHREARTCILLPPAKILSNLLQKLFQAFPHN